MGYVNCVVELIVKNMLKKMEFAAHALSDGVRVSSLFLVLFLKSDAEVPSGNATAFWAATGRPVSLAIRVNSEMSIRRVVKSSGY